MGRRFLTEENKRNSVRERFNQRPLWGLAGRTKWIKNI
jgi:hypothetical protein